MDRTAQQKAWRIANRDRVNALRRLRRNAKPVSSTAIREPVSCHHCGAIVYRTPSEIQRAKHVFCCVACKQADSDFISYAAKRHGDTTRFRGEGRGYVKENGRHQHRVVAERVLGRPLLRGEVVHHIDGNKRNNAPENLSVMTQREHAKLHSREMLDAKKGKAA